MKLDSLGGTDVNKAEDQFKREGENNNMKNNNMKQDTSDKTETVREKHRTEHKKKQ